MKTLQKLLDMPNDALFVKDDGDVAVFVKHDVIRVPPDDTVFIFAPTLTLGYPPVVVVGLAIGDPDDGQVVAIFHDHWSDPTILPSLEVQDTIGVWIYGQPCKRFLLKNPMKTFAREVQEDIAEHPRWTREEWAISLLTFGVQFDDFRDLWNTITQDAPGMN